MIRAIVTDIEGTTTALSFVKDELFPYARRALAGFVRAHRGDPQILRILEDTATQTGHPLSEDAAIATLELWSDEDRKITPLKALQGLIWEAGYRDGALNGHLYADVPRHLRSWHAAGIRLYVYSSGSVHAQKLLFGHTAHGDLTPLFSGYFDTRTGAKLDAEAYRAITQAIGLPPGEILFLSDIAGELQAARAAGLAVCQLLRGDPDTRPVPGDWPLAASFDDVALGEGRPPESAFGL